MIRKNSIEKIIQASNSYPDQIDDVNEYPDRFYCPHKRHWIENLHVPMIPSTMTGVPIQASHKYRCKKCGYEWEELTGAGRQQEYAEIQQNFLKTYNDASPEERERIGVVINGQVYMRAYGTALYHSDSFGGTISSEEAKKMVNIIKGNINEC